MSRAGITPPGGGWAVGGVEGGPPLVGRASLQVPHRPYGAGVPLDREQDLRDEFGQFASLDLLADRRAAVGDRFDAGPSGALGGRGEFVEGGGGMAALAAQLHLALVDDHLAQERVRVADRFAVALFGPRRGDRDLEEVAEGVASSGTAESERPGERHEQRGLQLAVAGEPGARVMRGRGRCQAQGCLPGCEMLNEGRRTPAIGCPCTARSARAVPVSVREPEGSRERGEVRSNNGAARRGARHGSDRDRPWRGTVPAVTITSRRALDNS